MNALKLIMIYMMCVVQLFLVSLISDFITITDAICISITAILIIVGCYGSAHLGEYVGEQLRR